MVGKADITLDLGKHAKVGVAHNAVRVLRRTCHVKREQQSDQMMTIRKETTSDASAIEAVTVAAFRDAAHASHTEHFIIRALRDSGQLIVSLVAVDEGLIVGHVAVSPVTISDGSSGWYGLAPISVDPDRQRQGVGSLLMKGALEELRALGAAGCVVLGDPGYYSRFGFRAEPALVLPGVPAEYFQAISFGGDLPPGHVTYGESFEATAG